jgi:hypothetical protein
VASRFPHALKRAFRAAVTHPLLDARGRQVRLYNSRRRMLFDDPSADFPQTEFERVYRRLFPRFSIRRSPRAQLAIGLLWPCAALAFMLSVSSSMRYALIPAGIIVPFGALFGARTTRRWFWGAPPDAVAAALLSEGRCPSCAYRLAAIRAGPDGVTVCPECGAAWRLSRNHAPTGPAIPRSDA